MALIRKTIKVGNSAGVLLPKKLLGAEVKIIVVKGPIDIKKEIFRMLAPYLQDIRGIYITNKNPIEVLAISTEIKETIDEKIKLNIVPLKILKKDMGIKPLLRQKLAKAEIILNQALLSELRKEIRDVQKNE